MECLRQTQHWYMGCLRQTQHWYMGCLWQTQHWYMGCLWQSQHWYMGCLWQTQHLYLEVTCNETSVILMTSKYCVRVCMSMHECVCFGLKWPHWSLYHPTLHYPQSPSPIFFLEEKTIHAFFLWFPCNQISYTSSTTLVMNWITCEGHSYRSLRLMKLMPICKAWCLCDSPPLNYIIQNTTAPLI